MRIKVDYEPGFIKDDYGSIAEFRAKFQDQMQAGAEAHQRLKELIEGTIDKK